MAEKYVNVVTGAGSGIGRAVCQQLAERGHRLALVGRRSEPLQETMRRCAGSDQFDAIAISADITDPSACQDIIDQVVERWGRLDGLVNNAGLAELTPMSCATPEAITRIFAVNLFGPIHLTKAAWPILARQNAGCVVNVSSMSATDPFPGLGLYGAAKAGAEALVRAIVNEGRRHNLRAFAVAPGAVETDMLRNMFSTQALPEDMTLRPEDVAEVIVGCLVGEREEVPGSTIHVHSPS